MSNQESRENGKSSFEPRRHESGIASRDRVEQRSSAVMVVEGNPVTRKMLRLALEGNGYPVVEAADGRTALAAASSNMPAVILQDLVLPDMNGFDLIGKLRALAGGEETPIVALSGFLNRVDAARTAQAGFTALLVKPVEPQRLIDTIVPYFPARIEGRSPGGRGRRVLVVDDDPVQLRLTRIRLEQYGFEVTTATNAVEALVSARTRLPDVVLADVLMPDLDGYQLCFELRRDPKLALIPVVLASAWYQTDADQDLANRVGASGLVLRTPDLRTAAEALVTALQEGPPAQTEEPSDEVKLTHARAVIHQLEQRLMVNEDLGRRCTMQAAQISLLGGLADMLARKAGLDSALRDVLAATLDAAGISKGAIFLRDEEAGLVLRHAIGFSASEQGGLSTFFGQIEFLRHVIERQATVAIPSAAVPVNLSRLLLARASVKFAQIVPLVSEGHGTGAIFLASSHTSVSNEESIAFARAIGNQLAQSLELASSFARLAASEQRYRTVTESANDVISLLTPEGVIVDANRSLEQAVELPRDQIVGRTMRDLAWQQDRDDAPWYRASLAQGRTIQSLRKPNGTLVLMEFSSKEVEVGGARLVSSIGRDVTEQVQAQAQLIESDRMACIATLSAGVVHEVTNPLAAATANLECAVREAAVLAGKFEPHEFADLEQLLRETRDAVDRVSTIVHDLKLFSIAEDDKRSAVDVHRLLESSLRVASHEIRHRARVIKDYQRVPPVEANAARLGHVFLHLTVNAALSLPEGQAHSNQIRIRTRMDPAGRVIVEVEDTGPGMPPEVVERLFSPTFSVGPSGVASGLGLFVCHRIIAGLGGDIQVESALGRGTLFRVLLPVAPTDASRRETMPDLQIDVTKQGRILVVDDEPVIGAVVRRILATEHEVVTTTSAREALERIVAGEKFDVILCDVMMPVMTGVEFYRELVNRSPEHAERIVFVTAGAFTVRAREFLDEVPNPRLDKPFEVQALRAIVNQRLR